MEFVFKVRPPVDVFLFSAFFVLLLQTYKDMKTQKVDSRRNWVIQGELLAFVLLGLVNFIAYLALVVATTLFNILFLKSFWGEGDTEILAWLIPGLILLAGPFYALVFLLSFALFTAVVFSAKKFFKVSGEVKSPGVPLIFGAFLMVVSMFYFF